MDEALTENVAAIADAGVITLERVAQDGMQAPADAGAASLWRQASLEEHLGQARELLRTLKTLTEVDPGQDRRRAQAAKLRAAHDREQRIQAALDRLPELAAAKRRNGGKPENARAGTTDAQASVMRMGDGGWRPAYNVQFATDCAAQVIVDMDVVTTGSDMAQLAPMVEQVEQRLGKTPGQWLVDGGFPAHEQLNAVAGKTELYVPVPKSKARKEPKARDEPKDEAARPARKDAKSGDKPNDTQRPAPISESDPKPGDSDAVAQWRKRMNTDGAREIYRNRAATAECVNAQAHAQSGQSHVRGAAVRARAQPDTHGRSRTPVDRLGRRCEINIRSGRVRAEKCVNASQNAPCGCMRSQLGASAIRLCPHTSPTRVTSSNSSLSDQGKLLSL